MSQINHEFGQPKSPSNCPLDLSISYHNFSNGAIPIYWGPNQETRDTYGTPKASAWNNEPLLRIPCVARIVFLGLGEGDVETDDYVEPTPTMVDWVVWGYTTEDNPAAGNEPYFGVGWYALQGSNTFFCPKIPSVDATADNVKPIIEEFPIGLHKNGGQSGEGLC